jgi:hypothetical protein
VHRLVRRRGAHTRRLCHTSLSATIERFDHRADNRARFWRSSRCGNTVSKNPTRPSDDSSTLQDYISRVLFYGVPLPAISLDLNTDKPPMNNQDLADMFGTDVVVSDEEVRLESIADCWALTGAGVNRFALVNEYLSLADRNYSPQTVRVYGFSLLAFCRWLASEEIDLELVSTDALLRYLAPCRQATVPGPSRSQCRAHGWPTC